jgi:hemerythrin-like domain-containing protein
MKVLLSSDHLEIDSVLDELFAALEKGDAAEVYQKLDFFWARLAVHIRAEHLHLFPAILEAVQEDGPNPADDLNVSATFVRDTIGQLKIDHNFFMRELGELIKQMLAMREDRWRDERGKLKELRERINLLRARLEHHNELEEIYVYSWAEKLDLPDAPGLRSKIQNELENLPPRFRGSV